MQKEKNSFLQQTFFKTALILTDQGRFSAQEHGDNKYTLYLKMLNG